MAASSASYSIHQRSRSLRAPTSNSIKSLHSTTPQLPPTTLSAPISTSSGPSHISLFLTNLRLLDLDQRDDWPDITALTFSTKDSQQNQRKRIQCVEWALYHLFEIWDLEETQNVRYNTIRTASFFSANQVSFRNCNPFSLQLNSCSL